LGWKPSSRFDDFEQKCRPSLDLRVPVFSHIIADRCSTLISATSNRLSITAVVTYFVGQTGNNCCRA
jgi:hypothetical protein